MTTVYKGLQSCLKLQHVEPLTLHLRLAPVQSHSPQPIVQVEVTPHVPDSVSDIEEPEVHSGTDSENTQKNTSSGDFGGWSFLEDLTKEAQEDKETAYVHPLEKRSLSTLSSKSLDLCTEGLGCETGSDIGDDSDLYFSSSSDSESTRRSPTRERSRFCQPLHKKAIRRSFPPPLTSIRGSDYVQVTPHREGGRLVIKAIKIANAATCFQAERGNGRLRLQFKRSSNSSSSSDEDTEDDDEEEKEHHCSRDEKLNANTCNAIVEYQRPCSWYNDSGNKRLLNWKPFLRVAT